jgi:hypothetical protein
MEENLHWIFWAYGLGWALVFVYLFWISRREQDLRRRVSELRELLNDHNPRR